MQLLLAPGFRKDFAKLPDDVRAEFKANWAEDNAGRLIDGHFTARLRGSKLIPLDGFECLAGKSKMYLGGSEDDDGGFRLVFQQSGNTVLAIAAGTRRGMAVYKAARERLKALSTI